MVRLREIPRTAAFAWSPGTGLPLIATGTRAGAVDADFSDDTSLELWNLNLGDPDQRVELKPSGSISTDSRQVAHEPFYVDQSITIGSLRFHDIAWGRITPEHPWGIIAGALENGSLDLWDADSLLKDSKNAFISRTTKHSGAIKALQFNPVKPELLATAGAKGELFISDLNNVDNPFRLGNTAARADDFETVDWNKKVPHILVTGSSGGFVTVWDVKAKKENLTLNNMGRKAVSAVAWDPEQPTKLITAIPDDTNPLILVWDLRNSQAPERTLKAHDQGVLSLSWCQQDSNLLLSCGKDNRTICWNPRTGEPYGEFPVVTNWTFQTRWNPHNPSLLATASFDGKIGIQTIQNTSYGAERTSKTQEPNLDGEDFFNSASTQPQEATFSLPVPPKWLERPVGVSFGFGGKVVSFGLDDKSNAASRKSKINITQFEIDTNVGTATDAFEKALQEGGLAGICQKRIGEAKTDEEKADWQVMETLMSQEPRKKLVEFLGFSVEVSEEIEVSGEVESETSDSDKAVTDNEVLAGRKQPNGDAKANRLSSFFDKHDDDDGFLSAIAATKRAQTNNPFDIYTGSESAQDKKITQALLLGRLEEALDVCLQEGRMSDAFMIAICGGDKCIAKAETAYFNKKGTDGPNYLRLLASVTKKNLWDVVYNADLKNWKEIIAMLCTHAKPEEFPDLCEVLGDRLDEQSKKSSTGIGRKDAAFCYLAGSKLEKVVAIWIEQLQEGEEDGFAKETKDSAFSIHARSLQNLIEKVTIFRAVTKFQDPEQSASADWKLALLYDKYAEYADIVASLGQLQTAEKYLDLLPSKYPAAELARNRVKQAARKGGSQSVVKQTATNTRAAGRAQPVMAGYQSNNATAPAKVGYQPPQPPAPLQTPYAPSAPAQQNPYAPSASNSYTPAGYQQAQPAQSYNPPQQSYGGYPQQQGYGVPPPPRGTTASPPIPPPSKARSIENWNDVPIVTKPASLSRRGTPGLGSAAPITSPFPGQQPGISSPPPPTGPPYGMQQRPVATPPPPPPPKGVGPPPRVNSPLTAPPINASQYQTERPSSSAASHYAPPTPSSHLSGQIPTIPRGASPYNAPPTGAPPSNRYAPAPSQSSNQSYQAPGSVAPPPQGGMRGPPPPNPYAPSQQSGPPQGMQGNYGQGAPPPNFNQPPPSNRAQPPLPGGTPSGQRPGTSGSGQGGSTAPAQAPPARKYPPGDRAHIPSEAVSVYEVLNEDMQRVKARAPVSFKPQVLDAEKRLNQLFDHLNNEDLVKPDTVAQLVELAQAMKVRDYTTAQQIQQDIHKEKTDECGSWMIGVNRLIRMSKATP
ncbi:MAG: protein transport protein S31 [Vezdaea aestivalis]|nr:MAG: protein transport protein S31 [Vezdaea aestivalis]